MLARVNVPAGTAPRPSITSRARHPVISLRPAFEYRQLLAPVHASGPAPLVYVEGYKEVEELAGARIVADSDTPRIEYLTRWKVRP